LEFDEFVENKIISKYENLSVKLDILFNAYKDNYSDIGIID
jgi:hypothetical protein